MFIPKDITKLEEILGRSSSNSNTSNTEKYSEKIYDSSSALSNKDNWDELFEKFFERVAVNRELIAQISKCEKELNELKETQNYIKTMTKAVTRVSNLIAAMAVISIVGIIIFLAIAIYAHYTSDYAGAIFYVLGIIGVGGLYQLFKLNSWLEKLSEKEFKQ